MAEVTPTNLLVAARGHALGTDGFQLSQSTLQRVETAVAYYHSQSDAFAMAQDMGRGGKVVMSGGYATIATGYRFAPPPYELREGSLMAAHAAELGVPDKHLYRINSPTTTLEVVLRPFEEGLFANITPDNPLGIVTQASQWPRLNWFARRIFKLPAGSVQLIAAPGEESLVIHRDERRLMNMTRIVYGPARSPQGLRRAERCAAAGLALLVKVGLAQPPASRYLNDAA